ncbi:zinc finger protein 605-like [Brachyistius frenatus]|uniref:zinc finger protein 605-like n=1 Tax=Brachyistius frenatus TaxID=100188 RepID=UPI0037E9C77E
MSKLHQLKLFVNERLTAAAEEIFGAVERTILEFQSDIYGSTEDVKYSELLTLAEALKREEVFTQASPVPSVSIQPSCTEDRQVGVKLHTPRPEFLEKKEHWPSGDKGRLQDLFQGEAFAFVKSEQRTESCCQSQTVAGTEGELLLPHTSTEWKKTEEEMDGYGGFDFCQPISSDSGAENDTGDAEWMKSSGLNSCSTAAKANASVKQRQDGPILNTQPRTNEKPFCCKLCGKAFHRRYSLTIHLKTHANNTPAIRPSNHAVSAEIGPQLLETYKEDNLCHICGKTFTTRTHLKRHMLIHTGQKPHCCKECGRRFARGESLRIHMRIHTVETPYTCEVCKKGFRQRSNLISHMRMHTGEKPYRCGICSRPFAYKKDMMRHTQVHTKT